MTVYELIRQNITARQVAEMYGLRIDRMGHALCPWHDDHRPSMRFYPDGKCWCFACNNGGDAVDLTSQMFGLAPDAAIEKLKTDFRLDLPTEQRKKRFDPRQKAIKAVKQAERERVKAWEAVRDFVGKTESPECQELMRLANDADAWLRFKEFELKQLEDGYRPKQGKVYSDADKAFNARWGYLCDVVREAEQRLSEYTPESAGTEFDLVLAAMCRANEELDVMQETGELA